MRFRCEQKKGATRQTYIKSHTETLSLFYRFGGGNGTVVNLTAAENQESSNYLVLHRGLKVESGTTSS